MRSVIFDLDGTLADTSGDLIAAANAAFVALGLPPQLTAADAGTAMRGGRAMLTLGYSRLGAVREADIGRAYPILLAAYRDAIDTHTVLYPGAMAAVAALRAQGFGVGICTNKPEGLAELLLTRLGVREAFGSLVGADTLPVRKPDPAPLWEAVRRLGGDLARTCLVGDSDTDRKTAAAAGCPSILVTFGPDGGQMPTLQPEALLDHFDHLPELVGRLVP